eukprot:gene29522-64025_t
MGQGKTTVITPLLSLMLADGRHLISVCTPRALVPFTRSVLRERFSSTVLTKQVLTVEFDRFWKMTSGLYRKLEAAVDSRSVCVVAPSVIKAMLLKVIELMESLDTN